MDYIEAREKLREAKRTALANSCNIKVGRRELEVALDALSRPDMREKVREYIGELDKEYDICIGQAESILSAIGDYDEKPMPSNYIRLVERAEVLNEVKNDLESRLEELI